MYRNGLRNFPTNFDDPLPAFNEQGLLPAGDYSPKRFEFEERFVKIDNVIKRAGQQQED